MDRTIDDSSSQAAFLVLHGTMRVGQQGGNFWLGCNLIFQCIAIKYLFKKYLFLFYVYRCLPVCINACLMLAQGRRKSQFPRTEVTDNCEPLCVCYKLSLGLLQEQKILLFTGQSYLLVLFVCLFVFNRLTK